MRSMSGAFSELAGAGKGARDPPLHIRPALRDLLFLRRDSDEENVL